MKRPSCILLLSGPDYLSNHASAYCHLLFDVKYEGRYDRHSKQLETAVDTILVRKGVDYLFNFLSPVIVPATILKKIRKAAINFHPAPPKWPGVGSASFALFEGDISFGVTAHIMNEAVDAGKIVKSHTFPILPSEQCDVLFDRALVYTLMLFYEVLWDISIKRGLSYSKQTWLKKPKTRKQFDDWLRIQITDPPSEIRKKIQAARHSKLPGPFIEFEGYRFELPPYGTDTH